MYVAVCVHICIYMCVWLNSCMSVCTSGIFHVFLSIKMCVWLFVYIGVFTCMFVCLIVCVYEYFHVCGYVKNMRMILHLKIIILVSTSYVWTGKASLHKVHFNSSTQVS